MPNSKRFASTMERPACRAGRHAEFKALRFGDEETCPQADRLRRAYVPCAKRPALAMRNPNHSVRQAPSQIPQARAVAKSSALPALSWRPPSNVVALQDPFPISVHIPIRLKAQVKAAKMLRQWSPLPCSGFSLLEAASAPDTLPLLRLPLRAPAFRCFLRRLPVSASSMSAKTSQGRRRNAPAAAFCFAASPFSCSTPCAASAPRRRRSRP